MKRTFLVEIDGELEKGFGVEGVCDVFDQFIVAAQVSVTETTAVHAKEREVIDAAIDQALTNGRTIAGYNEWVTATEVTDEKARELRALMEGKA